MPISFNNTAADLGVLKQIALFQQTEKAKDLRFHYNLSDIKEARVAFMMYFAYVGTPTLFFSKN